MVQVRNVASVRVAVKGFMKASPDDPDPPGREKNVSFFAFLSLIS